MSVPDRQLLEAWQAGEQRAGERLFSRHFPAVLRFFRNKAPEHCDELVQRTFEAILRKRTDFRRESTFRTFLFGVARLEWLSYLRRLSRTPEHLDIDSASVHDYLPSPSHWMAEAQDARALLGALRKLKIEQQIAIELQYWEGLTMREIAVVLDRPEGTVKSILRAARVALAKALAQDLPDGEMSVEDIDAWASVARKRARGALEEEKSTAS